jgi:nitrite reductase (NADH) large subunit
MKVVIIGNGIAGILTASKLRELDSDPENLEIEIYTREPYEYYARIRLPEACASQLTAEDLEIYKPDWYAKKHVQVYKNTEVVEIDRPAKEIVLKNGTRVEYDKLVLAMGSDSFKLPIPNADLHGVFTIREYGDAEAIRSYLTEGTRHVVVVGGGLLGLEAARHLRNADIDTMTIVEIFPRLLPKQLDADGARLLQTTMERMGCECITGAQIEEFVGDKQVESVRLKDGRELPAETVLISAGIKPRIQLAADTGLEVNRGIIVDEHLRSTDEDIYVAGDLVEFEGIVWGIIPAAMDHAPVIANNIVGNEDVHYRQTIPRNTLKVAGIDLTSFGKVTFDDGGEEEYEIISKIDEDAERYEKYVLKDGMLVGSILLGSTENLKFVTDHIARKMTREEIESQLW